MGEVEEKALFWVGSSYDDLLAFPDSVRRLAGFQLGKVQAGLEPDDWKPFAQVGPGVREIRLRDDAGAWRVMYVAKFEEGSYVRHCFQKTTRATSTHDKAVAETRDRAILARRAEP